MFPGSCPPSIFSAEKLNYCVRNGNRCDLLAITTRYRRNKLRSARFGQYRQSLAHFVVAPLSQKISHSLNFPGALLKGLGVWLHFAVAPQSIVFESK